MSAVMPTIGRRRLGDSLLAVGAVVSAASMVGAARVIASASVNPDAELLAIGADTAPIIAHYDRLLAKWWSLKCGEPELVDCAAELAIPADQLRDLAELARDIHASTPEGWTVKAELIRFLMTVEHSLGGTMQFESFDQEVMWSLICDMTARA